jgi:hypothetical protein
MPTLKLHYEGWVALPAGLCQQLGLKSGDRLGVDLVDGTIMLRPVAMAKRLVSRADPRLPIDPPAPDGPETLMHTEVVPARRKPGRPRKHEAGHAPAIPETKRSRGRPRLARTPEPEPAPVAVVSSEPWKLRRKADLQPLEPATEPAIRPSPLPHRMGSATGSPGDERRPFRNVEVRKLGPGRQHNRS